MTNKHFILTEDTLVHEGITLHRIKSTRDMLHRGVKKGDVGGFVEREDNLGDNAWVYNDAKVFEGAYVSNDAMVFNNAEVLGDARVSGSATIVDNARIFDNAHIFLSAEVFGNARVFGNAVLSSRSQVGGDAHVFGSAMLLENEAVSTNGRVSQPIHVATGTVCGNSTYGWTLYATADGGVRGNISGWKTSAVKHLFWSGSPDDLVAVVDSDAWIFEDDIDTEEARPELAALASLWKVREARMSAQAALENSAHG